MKRLQWIALAPALLVLGMAVTEDAAAKVSETIHQVYDTSSHPLLRVKNINGDLSVEGWDKNRIEVTAVKSAKNQEDLDNVQVFAEKNGDRVSIRVEYKHDRDEWDHNQTGSVDFTIHVPKGTEIDKVEFVNGDIDITGIEGDVEASSVNGEVTGQKLGGEVALSTVNGGVELVATGDISSVRLNSVNGDISLVLPKKFDARIEAGTLHGDITAIDGADVDATRFSGTSMRATLGKGTMRVDLNTVNGSIEIRREGEGGTRDKE